MSDTPVDYTEVTKVLEAGWTITLRQGEGSIIAEAEAPYLADWHWADELMVYTDDFTIPQVLTRIAYKVQGKHI